MFTLDTFYQSTEWRGLLAVLKNERLNEEGQIICEYCGKPITRAYDVIGHHKEHLTEENVNDYSVSLNPENVAFVHHKCHNYIHNKLGYMKREIYLVYGPPLSGKTTWVRENMSEGDLIIDIDNIWQCVSGCDRYVKPNRLKSVVFMVRDDLLEAVKYRRGKWNSAYIVGGYPLSSERERLCRELGAREIFFDVPMDECLKRLEDDAERNVENWSAYVEKWFEEYGKYPPHGGK